MVWTSSDDVIGSWIGDDAPTDDDLVDVWIGRAERLLKRKVPTLTTRLELIPPEADLLETIQDVVSNMVQRVFRNPEGLRQKSLGTGPYTESGTFGGDQPGYLWVTDEELASLTGAVSSSGGAFMVDTMPPTAGSAYTAIQDVWADV